MTKVIFCVLARKNFLLLNALFYNMSSYEEKTKVKFFVVFKKIQYHHTMKNAMKKKCLLSLYDKINAWNWEAFIFSYNHKRHLFPIAKNEIKA